MVSPLCTLLVAMLVVMVTGQDYSGLDKNKLDQRYNIIHSLVTAGVGGTPYRPQIGGGYRAPHLGYGHKAPHPAPYQAPNPYAAARAPTYGAYNPHGAYKPQAAYNPHAARGYAGYGGHPGHQVHQARPSGYPAHAAAHASPYNHLAGLKIGGGSVHPIFNNANLYAPRPTPALPSFNPGTYSSKDPVYIGGPQAPNPGLYSQAGLPQKTPVQPQYNAYGGKVPSYTDNDAISRAKENLYQSLPGASDNFRG